MEKKYNTTIDFEFCDGTTAKLTLTFYALYQLKSKNKALYNRYNNAMSASAKGGYDELEMLTILYVAYMCANMNEADCMSEEQFIEKCGSDRVAVGNAVKQLTSPKN
jgi:hypothetical protein